MGVFSLQGYKGKLVAGNGIVLDLFKDEEILISNNSTEIFDIGAVPSTYSKAILLPGTKLNNAFFEEYFDFAVESPNSWRSSQKVRAYFDFDGTYLVDGYVQLNKVNVYQNKFVDSYEVSLFGIVSNLSVDLKRKFLTDTEGLKKFNHTGSITNVTSSWAGDLFSGSVVYQIADSGQQYYYSDRDLTGIDEYVKAINLQDLKPSIKVKDVWDAIFLDAGYTYTGSFWNETWLDKVYLVANNNRKSLVISGSDIEDYGSFKVTLSNSSSLIYTDKAYELSSIKFVNKEYDTNEAYLGGVYTIGTRTPLRGKIRLNFQVTGSTGKSNQNSYPAGFGISVTDATTGTQVAFTALAKVNKAYNDGIATPFRSAYLSAFASNTQASYKQDFDLEEEFNTSALPPGKYKFNLYIYKTTNNDIDITLDAGSSSKSYFQITKQDWLADYKVIDIPSNMPFGESGIKQIELISAIQKKFNLVLYADKTKPNQFICETFNNWYRQGEIKDFNKYIDQGSSFTIEPLNQYTINKVTFTGKQDKDYISDTWQKTFNRTYGAAFYQDTQSYYSQGEFKVENVIADAPLVRVPSSFTSTSGSAGNCITYRCQNRSASPIGVKHIACSTGNLVTQSIGPFPAYVDLCARVRPEPADALSAASLSIVSRGDCGTYTGSIIVYDSGSDSMFIPYYINNASYSGSRVYPRLMFYNGLKNVQPYAMIGSGSTEGINSTYASYPYFDNYSVENNVAGPATNSLSLLYNNEYPSFGTLPTSSLLDAYWSNYLDLYYNPQGKLIKCSVVIPLADYFNTELNDLAFFRGEYYHIRAINDYNLSTGEASLQLIGPILPDALSSILTKDIGDCNLSLGSAVFVSNNTPTPTPTPSPTPTPTPTPPPEYFITDEDDNILTDESNNKLIYQ